MDPLILQKLQKTMKALISERVLALDDSKQTPQIDISFLAPNSDYVADLGSLPSINCYLMAINEDKNRRKSESHRTTINVQKTHGTLYREPKFVDLSFMITVWCKDKQGSAEIENMILGYLLCGLGVFDFIPEDMLDRFGINSKPYGIHFNLFGNENSDKVNGQVWQAMGSTPKPCLMLSVSIPVAVHEPTHMPIIQEIDRVTNPK
jgi:hypothetical protein